VEGALGHLNKTRLVKTNCAGWLTLIVCTGK
jgi:hypothetical protein